MSASADFNTTAKQTDLFYSGISLQHILSGGGSRHSAFLVGFPTNPARGKYVRIRFAHTLRLDDSYGVGLDCPEAPVFRELFDEVPLRST